MYVSYNWYITSHHILVLCVAVTSIPEKTKDLIPVKTNPVPVGKDAVAVDKDPICGETKTLTVPVKTKTLHLWRQKKT